MSLDSGLHFRVFRTMSRIVAESDNWIYFAGPIWYNNRLTRVQHIYKSMFEKHRMSSSLSQEWFPFLYPPNLASIDFLLRTFENPRLAGVLDFGCGVGAFGVYASRLGFPIWLYDSASQLSRSALSEFWSAFGLESALVHSWDDAGGLPVKAINCIGTGLGMEGRSLIADIRTNPSVEFLLLDTQRHRPRGIPGFTLHAWYPGLIWVFKRS